MGSSGSSNFRQPTIPTPPNTVPYGQTSGFTPSYVNFLGDPSVPSTGLTPAMLQQIDSGAYAKPVQQEQPAAGGAGAPSNYQQMLNFFGQMMGGGMGGGMPSGGGLTPYGRAMFAQRNAPTIPAPPSGASSADMAAYQAMQEQQRTQLAKQMSSAQRQMRQRHAR
jgi:hypothetical protein